MVRGPERREGGVRASTRGRATLPGPPALLGALVQRRGSARARARRAGTGAPSRRELPDQGHLDGRSDGASTSVDRRDASGGAGAMAGRRRAGAQESGSGGAAGADGGVAAAVSSLRQAGRMASHARPHLGGRRGQPEQAGGRPVRPGASRRWWGARFASRATVCAAARCARRRRRGPGSGRGAAGSLARSGHALAAAGCPAAPRTLGSPCRPGRPGGAEASPVRRRAGRITQR